MSKPGRPEVLDKAKMDKIIGLLTLGATRTLAARYVGCHPNTIRNTALRNPEFAERLRNAEYHLEFNLVKQITEAAKDQKHWRAAAWALERIFPQRYAARGPNAITTEQVHELLNLFANVVYEAIPEEHFRAKIEERLQQITHQINADGGYEPGHSEHSEESCNSAPSLVNQDPSLRSG